MTLLPAADVQVGDTVQERMLGQRTWGVVTKVERLDSRRFPIRLTVEFSNLAFDWRYSHLPATRLNVRRPA